MRLRGRGRRSAAGRAAAERAGRRRSGPGAGRAGRAPASAGYPSSASWL